MSSPATLTRRRALAALLLPALPPLPAFARGGLPLMLSREAPPDLDPAGFLVSEKLDGVRALWDGRTLRFRSGLPVPAPAWFTAALPATALDGELWSGRGQFETLVGTVRRERPVSAEWAAVRFAVFDEPGAPDPFETRAARLAARVQAAGAAHLVAVAHEVLPDRAALQRRLDEVLGLGGEGLMLHRAQARWQRGRSADLLKLKPLADAEAQVVGHEPGRGRHAGRLGALRVRTAEGVEFRLGTGFSDAEREAPPAVGEWVTFTHRGLTGGGVPRFASYLRRRAL